MRTPALSLLFTLGIAVPAAFGQSPSDPRAGLAAVTSDIVGYPITTSSDAARRHFQLGQRDLDLQHAIDAFAHFQAAVAADSTFAIAYLNAANTSNTAPEFRRYLELAERHASHASPAERLVIQMLRRGLENDLEGQLRLANQLVQSQPQSARALVAQGGVLGNMNRTEESRAAWTKALTLAPKMFIAHINLGNSYLFNEPRDATRGLAHFQQAVQLAPNDPTPHDFVGDAYRALGKMPEAKAAYTRAHQLAPREAIELQQRGHVNSFAGDFAAARADYDSAMALGRANEKGAYGVWRALVSVYAGDPKAAVTELQQLATAVDGMGIPDPRAVKINALTNVALIATHTGDFATAERALRERTPLIRQQADEIGNPAFQRGQEQGIVYFDAWLAARRGDYTTAQQFTEKLTQLVEPDANPRKMEPVHELRGYVALYQRQYSDAVTHFEQGDLTNIYIKYQLALAHEGAGHRDQAKELFADVANYNFNTAQAALVRAAARQKAAT